MPQSRRLPSFASSLQSRPNSGSSSQSTQTLNVRQSVSRRHERDRRERLPLPRPAPLQKLPSKRSAAKSGHGPRTADPSLTYERGRLARSSAPPKLARSQTPPPRFATAGDHFARALSLTPLSVQLPRTSRKASPPQLGTSNIAPSATPSSSALDQSPSAASDRWTSASEEDLSSDNEGYSPIRLAAMRNPHHQRPSTRRRSTSSDDPSTPIG